MPVKLPAIILSLLISCVLAVRAGAVERSIMVSVRDQKLAIVEDGNIVARFPVSTSRFGVGDDCRSYRTPLGRLEVVQKIGYNLPPGAVIKGRRYTGEVLKPNTGGRDPIVTRVIWLRGLESRNRNAHDRGIYIHGTPVERQIGRPASYGCIRMKSRDVVEVFKTAQVGTPVEIVDESLRSHLAQHRKPAPAAGEAAKGEPSKVVSKAVEKVVAKTGDKQETASHGYSLKGSILASALPATSR
jgi:lipoprotein-anchoring transpeptidase ErfK/SrfK